MIKCSICGFPLQEDYLMFKNSATNTAYKERVFICRNKTCFLKGLIRQE
jgi:hypothetical protein